MSMTRPGPSTMSKIRLSALSQNARIQAILFSPVVLSSLHLLETVMSPIQLTRVPRISSRSLQLVFKSLVFLVLLLNIRAIPGGWHWRVFWVITKVRIQYLLQRTRASFALTLAGKTGRRKAEALNMRMEKWLEGITPVGAHPLEFQTVYRTWVSLDESDFNGHMSNSSYPKVLDCARMKAAMELFPQFLRVGGVIPLSSTHFHFIKELPVFARYELRLSIGAWDEKWMYVVGRFITKNKTTKNTTRSSSKSVTPGASDETNVTIPAPSLSIKIPGSETAAVARLVTELGDSDISEEHVTLHTVCVSRVCFKHGRITVPPAVLMATNGVSVHPWELAGAQSSTSEQPKYSPSNPPPTWTSESKKLILKSMGGSPKQVREFYRGQWREVLDAEKGKVAVEGGDPDSYIPWWDRALGDGGPVEERQKQRLEICRYLVGGLEGVRGMVS
ncbi:hypothetical protein D9757_010690 [Collybiopsis confluens]|uniref:Uncharacterized protein n=1 Tax=Collybiopsis confluens TaxID=2823264 RepID=A0A8H5H793_9AGAR|nr:hypothetical protein D9757_009847 [Collybiopsis confluens]KAF5379280.1 hypothetical protein D9757_010690 [Collybiopsis confluens]